MRKKSPNYLHKKAGRPPSGKKQFCVRMIPTAHSILLQTAKAAGHSNLADWLGAFALLNLSEDLRSIDDMSPAELNTAFENICCQAVKVLSQLHELVDVPLPVTKRSRKAFLSVEKQYQKVVCLARNVGIRD
jgi:hypothetical protein